MINFPKFFPIDVLITSDKQVFLTSVLNTGFNGNNANAANLPNGESALVSQATVYCKYEKISRQDYEQLAIRYAQLTYS